MYGLLLDVALFFWHPLPITDHENASVITMDRSISSLFAGSSTRAHSPDKVEKAKNASGDLESNLSALGHVGLVKHQRNLLRQELEQQRLQTDEQRNAAASLRRLTLRLAVQLSVKEARIASHNQALSRSRSTLYKTSREKDSTIDELQFGLKEYQRQAKDLLNILNNGTAALSGVHYPN